MVAIGRALMSRPRLVLLDEPSGGLSPQLVADTARTLSALRRRGLVIRTSRVALGPVDHPNAGVLVQDPCLILPIVAWCIVANLARLQASS